MRIVKPYGRSETTRGESQLAKRQLRPRSDRATLTPVSDFAAKDGNLVIAQWISTIDKIATKPASSQKPTAEQRKLREEIGKAAWEKLTSVDPKFANELKKKWDTKIHPYKEGNFDAKGKKHPPSVKGRWYERFANSVEPGRIDAVDAKDIAERIYQHLYKGEFKKTGTNTKRQGRIQLRAKSIETNVHRSLTAMPSTNASWSDDSWKQYFNAGDIAATIYKKVYRKSDGGKPVMKNAGVEAAKNLYAHYGKLFTDANGNIIRLDAARNEQPGLLALHQAVCETYKALFHRKTKAKPQSIPRDNAALKLLMAQKRNNRDLAAMVRLGKVIHYQATSVNNALDTPNNIVTNWPENQIDDSRYWLSEGQTEIKRNEALVRVWRYNIALAASTLTDWAGPSQKGLDDIFSKKSIIAVCDTSFDGGAFNAKFSLLFGKQANESGLSTLDEKKALLRFALERWAQLRHDSFHFKGRAGFIAAVNKSNSNPTDETTKFINNLWSEDIVARRVRLRETLKAAHCEKFLDQDQLAAVYNAIVTPSGDHSPLPRFRRVLKRVETSWQKNDYKLTLPAPENREYLEKKPAALCRYTGLKLLFERAFPAWFDNQKTDQLNAWIKRAQERSTKAATTINKDDKAVSRASLIGTLVDEEKLAHFMDRLTAETATEFRVQRGYESDAGKAKEQAKFIDDLRCDVTAQAFEAYLTSKEFGWLSGLNADLDLPDSCKSTIGNLETDQQENANDADDWQKQLYFLIHMVPAGEVGKLLHQLRKWKVLEDKATEPNGKAATALQDDVNCMDHVFSLYLDMHDAKFEGGDLVKNSDEIKALFESESDFNTVFPSGSTVETDMRLPLRGLRELLRYGHLKPLKPIFEKSRISSASVRSLAALEEKNEDGNSQIATAQEQRTRLHDHWVNNQKNFNAEQRTEYKNALSTVIDHRHLSSEVRLTNHLRLHRLMMQVLARLTDYAGLWERDLYFVSLAMMHLGHGRSEQPKKFKDALEKGRIVEAIGKSCFENDLEQWFGNRFIDGGVVRHRNNFAHFNMLRKGNLNLTNLVNDARALMAYDRKLKNAVSGSIREMLARENIDLKWDMKDHALTGARLETRQAVHLSDKNITENLHSDSFVEMVANLFDDKAVFDTNVRKHDQNGESGKPGERQRRNDNRKHNRNRSNGNRHPGPRRK